MILEKVICLPNFLYDPFWNEHPRVWMKKSPDRLGVRCPAAHVGSGSGWGGGAVAPRSC